MDICLKAKFPWQEAQGKIGSRYLAEKNTQKQKEYLVFKFLKKRCKNMQLYKSDPPQGMEYTTHFGWFSLIHQALNLLMKKDQTLFPTFENMAPL